MKIEAKVIADSKNEFGNRITTMVITFPRFILAEFNTHRVISKNSASSRAIPFNKMVESVKNEPFIPIAWQKEHKGMQGTEYYDEDEAKICTQKWLKARDLAVYQAETMNEIGITKQLANRLLEPFMWHTVICTATEYDNFFELRCPQYEITIPPVRQVKWFRSKKDSAAYVPLSGLMKVNDMTNLEWLKINKGQAEIHMMALAEAMYDALNESTPELLQAGAWHIPYKKEIHEQFGLGAFTGVNSIVRVPIAALISSVMCARVSYTVPGHDLTEWTGQKYIDKALELANAKPLHASPFEHNAESMDENTYTASIRSNIYYNSNWIVGDLSERGWCRNFRGFIQLRAKLENS